MNDRQVARIAMAIISTPRSPADDEDEDMVSAVAARTVSAFGLKK